jgi:uncharacterized membrane protein
MANKKSSPPTRATQLRPLPIRIVKLHAYLFIGGIIGLGVIAFLPGSIALTTRLLAGWDIGVAIYLVLIQWRMMRCDVDRIRRRAAEQDEGAFAILLLTALATLASLIAIVVDLGGLKQAQQGDAVVQVALAVVTILLSWAFVHTIFAIHYAHEYYGERRDGKIGGLEFPGDTKPDYWDFLYFSLVIGMTSQVSDVQITSKVIRRVVSMHGVMAFFFNLTVLALTVNMVSNLI